MLELSKLLSIAQEEKKQHDRAEEIKDLDLTPLDYQLVRDNKDKRSIEFLEALIERIGLPNWVVQESTQRIARTENQTFGRVKDILVITGNTRRFFLRIFSDRVQKYFREQEFVNLTHITEVFAKVEDELKYVERCYIEEQEAQERERLRLEEIKLNEEKRRLSEIRERCRSEVVSVNENLRKKLKELAIASEKNRIVANKCIELVKGICSKEQDKSVKLMDVNIAQLPAQTAEFILKEKSIAFALLDNVCCKVEKITPDKATLSINPRDIYKCLNSSQQQISLSIPEVWFDIDFEENGIFVCTTNKSFEDWFPGGCEISEEVMINEDLLKFEDSSSGRQICIKRLYKSPLPSSELEKFIETINYTITNRIAHKTTVFSNINLFGTTYSISDKFLEFEFEKWTLTQIENTKNLSWKLLRDNPPSN